MTPEPIQAMLRSEMKHPDLYPLAEDMEASLIHDLLLDNIGVVHLALMVEDHYHVSITDETVHTWEVVGDIVRCATAA